MAKTKKNVQIVKLEATITDDELEGYGQGKLPFPVSEDLLMALFDISISGREGDKRVRIMYSGDCLDIYDPKGVKSIPIDAIISLRESAAEMKGRAEVREQLRGVLGITDGV